jgi:hypothetical protein
MPQALSYSFIAIQPCPTGFLFRKSTTLESHSARLIPPMGLCKFISSWEVAVLLTPHKPLYGPLFTCI